MSASLIRSDLIGRRIGTDRIGSVWLGWVGFGVGLGEDSVLRTAFDPQRALFSTTEDNLLFPNPNSSVAYPNDLELFEFIGRLLVSRPLRRHR